MSFCEFERFFCEYEMSLSGRLRIFATYFYTYDNYSLTTIIKIKSL